MTVPPSQVRDRLASRNGPRHSVYWVQPKSSSTKSKTPSSAASSRASSARPAEYAITGKYTGEWKDGTQHGYGVYAYGNGNKYEGEWQEGERHGQGTFWTASSEPSKPSRRGSRRSEEQRPIRKQYAGEWQHDQRHGVGTYFYPDGGTYEGVWVHNQREGGGRRTYGGNEPSVYDGEWQANKRSGFGTLVLANGDRYEGHWLDDKKEGPGRFYYASTHKVYEGEWVDDAPRCGEFRNIDPESADAAINNCCSSSFVLPELGLAHPSHVVSSSVAEIRQERLLASSLLDAADNKAENTGSPSSSDTVVGTLDAAMIERLTSAFQALEVADGTMQCQFLPMLLESMGLAMSNEHIDAFLDELGATSSTAISLADCIDIVALLAESANEAALELDNDQDPEINEEDDLNEDA